MGRKVLLICLLLGLPVYLFAQNPERIKEDPSVVWAEGKPGPLSAADESALDALVRMLAATDRLPLDLVIRERVWQTYRSDIRRESEMLVTPSGSVIRYLSWKQIPELFSARWRKVRELSEFASQASERGEQATARTYLGWAEIYLQSLPPGETVLREQVTRLRRSLGEGPVAVVPLRNIESEVALIRQALVPPVRETPDVSRKEKEALVQVAAPVLTRPVQDLLPDLPLPSALRPVPPAQALQAASVPLYDLTEKIPLQTLQASSESHLQFSALLLSELDKMPGAGFLVACHSAHFGGYVSMRGNFSPDDAGYVCRSTDGATDFGYLWASGKARYSRLSLSGGAIVRLIPSVDLFTGLGWGRRSLLWEDSSGGWARVEDLSIRGLSAETGLIWQISHLSLCAGVSSIRFRQISFMAGIGWCF